MKISKLTGLFDKAKKRFHIVGDAKNGVLVGLDLEGRLFIFRDGEVLSRVNTEAVLGQSTKDGYLNPGGDTLWPAPEGTCLGYEYPTGKWRVPPSLTGARYIVRNSKKNKALVEAEVDLVNNSGLGLPFMFSRDIMVANGKDSLKVAVRESITYMGTMTLSKSECMAAPWSLCQFDSGKNSEVVFPDKGAASRWDLYADPSDSQRSTSGGLCRTKTNGAMKYQIGIAESVDWIEYRNGSGLIVRRTAKPLSKGQNYIDISDAAPDKKPSKKGVRFSVYSDPSCFMEIEACGGCPDKVVPGAVMSVDIETVYKVS